MFRGSTSDAPLRTTRHRRESPLPSRDGPIPFPTGVAASLDVPVIVPEHYPAMGPFGAAVLDALEQRIPGIRDKVEVRDAATPVTWERYAGNRRGAYKGWLPSGKQTMMQIQLRRR
jgi:phytoene dehydrogenase-like protein